MTGMDYEIAAASVAVSATVGAAMAATEAVAVALAGNPVMQQCFGEVQLVVLFLMEEARRHFR